MSIIRNKEQQSILDYIKKVEDARKEDVSQPEIIRYFSTLWYEGDESINVRMKIGNKLKNMEKQGLIKKRKLKGRFGIPMNVWRTVDGEVREVPETLSEE